MMGSSANGPDRLDPFSDFNRKTDDADKGLRASMLVQATGRTLGTS